jgi:hypothetical protein
MCPDRLRSIRGAFCGARRPGEIAARRRLIPESLLCTAPSFDVVDDPFPVRLRVQRLEARSAKTSHRSDIVRLDPSDKQLDVSEVRKCHECDDHRGSITLAADGRFNNISKVARCHGERGNNAFAVRPSFPRSPAVSGAAVDVANEFVTIPRRESISAGLDRAAMLTQGTISEAQNQIGPTWTTQPALGVAVVEPRLDSGQLLSIEWLQAQSGHTLSA